MCEKVRETRADLGIALDGDADRVIIADERGHVIDGDQLMALIAKSWHQRGCCRAGGLSPRSCRTWVSNAFLPIMP